MFSVVKVINWSGASQVNMFVGRCMTPLNWRAVINSRLDAKFCSPCQLRSVYTAACDDGIHAVIWRREARDPLRVDAYDAKHATGVIFACVSLIFRLRQDMCAASVQLGNPSIQKCTRETYVVRSRPATQPLRRIYVELFALNDLLTMNGRAAGCYRPLTWDMTTIIVMSLKMIPITILSDWWSWPKSKHCSHRIILIGDVPRCCASLLQFEWSALRAYIRELTADWTSQNASRQPIMCTCSSIRLLLEAVLQCFFHYSGLIYST